MEPSQLRRAVDAGRATAVGLGLPVDEVVVVHDSDRVALRLLPCDLLARVTPQLDAGGAGFEVEIARRLTAVGAPVAELDPRVEPRIRVRDGFAISLWTYYPPTEPQIDPAAYADALARHHAALRRAEADLVADLKVPHFTERAEAALAVVTDRVRSPELPDAEREFLARTLRELSAEIAGAGAGEQVLHGEPHPGNLLATRRGPLFVDLGTCCRGPVEFDLAHAPEDVAAHSPDADQNLVRTCRALNWALFSAWRWRSDDRMPDRARLRTEGLDRVRALRRSGAG
ncbi:phosphotransferase [Streptomyces sp. Da 82-17]|uniref:phosphotransferase n=1 Tax=Streptomyces sp. Da 82-17 TaxID=3377116 RepID=UPI0038D368A9